MRLRAAFRVELCDLVPRSIRYSPARGSSSLYEPRIPRIQLHAVPPDPAKPDTDDLAIPAAPGSDHECVIQLCGLSRDTLEHLKLGDQVDLTIAKEPA